MLQLFSKFDFLRKAHEGTHAFHLEIEMNLFGHLTRRAEFLDFNIDDFRFAGQQLRQHFFANRQPRGERRFLPTPGGIGGGPTGRVDFRIGGDGNGGKPIHARGIFHFNSFRALGRYPFPVDI